jgi:hypothetical protein
VIRRIQLLGPEDRLPNRRLAAVGERIWEGLSRDNKVMPGVMATLALLVFAWLVMAALIGGSPDEEAANQASLAQDEEEPDSGEAESPAPGVEDRDTDSYSAFESKDPFRLPEGIEAKNDEGGDDKTGDSKSGSGKAGSGKAGNTKADSSRAGDNGGGNRSGGSRGGDTRSGGTRDNKDSNIQPSPGGTDFRGSQQGGSGDLFSSGGDLPYP